MKDDTPTLSSIETPNAAAIQAWCVDYVARILDRRPEQIDATIDVDRVGLDSSTAVALVMSLEEWLDIELVPELLFEYPTLASLSEHLAERVAEPDARVA